MTQKVIQINDVHFEEGTDKQQNIRVNLRDFKHCNGQSKTLLLTMDNSDVICPVSSRLNYLKLVMTVFPRNFTCSKKKNSNKLMTS
jgi:hypothetical protein